MSTQHLAANAASYLEKFCVEIANRRVGSTGNLDATHFFAERVASFGFATEASPFDCIDWRDNGARLSAKGTDVAVFPSPFSRSWDGTAPLVVVSTLDELAAQEEAAVILLLQGELAQEPLMPKSFTFYNPESHQRIIRTLEQLQPRAVLAAPPPNPGVAGAIYPVPLFEDGDFDIPSAFMREAEGRRLAQCAGQDVTLTIRSERIPAQGYNVVARKGTDPARRVVVFAHIDAKPGTPGALDNAAGVVVLLLLAERLADYAGGLTIELVALNGEDYYSNPGEHLYLAQQADDFANLLLGINIDGAGYYQGATAYSTYNCPPLLSATIDAAFSAGTDMVRGEPWYQSDHSLFLLYERPALAITSARFMHLMAEIVHTTDDVPAIVDPAKLAGIALTLDSLLRRLDQESV